MPICGRTLSASYDECPATRRRSEPFLFVAHFPPPATCIASYPQNSSNGLHQLKLICTPSVSCTVANAPMCGPSSPSDSTRIRRSGARCYLFEPVRTGLLLHGPSYRRLRSKTAAASCGRNVQQRRVFHSLSKSRICAASQRKTARSQLPSSTSALAKGSGLPLWTETITGVLCPPTDSGSRETAAPVTSLRSDVPVRSNAKSSGRIVSIAARFR